MLSPNYCLTVDITYRRRDHESDEFAEEHNTSRYWADYISDVINDMVLDLQVQGHSCTPPRWMMSWCVDMPEGTCKIKNDMQTENFSAEEEYIYHWKWEINKE